MENFPTYKKRVNFLFLETRNRYKLYLRLFQGLVASVVCFLVVYLNQRRDISITKPAQEIVYSLKSNLFRDGKFQSSLNYSKSGTDVIVYPLATPQHVKQADDHEDGLQLYIDKSSFRPSPKEQHLLTTTSKGPNHRAAGDHHHDPRFDTESLNSPTPDFESLVTLFAGFSRWADQNEIPYWIAHGNLLGWHWKSKSLSWDNCINVHVPANILFDMLSINGTIWSDRVTI